MSLERNDGQDTVKGHGKCCQLDASEVGVGVGLGILSPLVPLYCTTIIILCGHIAMSPPPSLLFYYWANKYTHSQGWIHYPNPLFIIFLLLHFCPLNINSFGKLDCLLFSRKEKEKKVGPKLKKSGNVVGKCTHTHTGHRNWNTKY